MLSLLEEKALEAYYIAEIIAERYIDSTQPLLNVYSKIFLLSTESAAKLKTLIERQEVKEIQSEGDYSRYCRIKQYNSIRFGDIDIDKEADEVLSIKHKAFMQLNELEPLKDRNSAKSAICDCLVNTANAGYIVICYTLGVFQAEGILFEKNYLKAKERLTKAADWNNISGLMALLYYGSEDINRDRYLTALIESLKSTYNSDLINTVQKVYGSCSGKRYDEIGLIEKAFNQGKIKREAYSKSYSRLFFSTVLNQKDKEAYVLSGNKEMFEEVCSLPLKLKAEAPKFESTALKDTILSDYSPKLDEKLWLIQSRQQREYRPLCIVSESKVVLDYFSEAMQRSINDANIERVDIADLNDSDFEPTQNNIFIRICDEESFNVYFLFFEGEIRQKSFEQATRFLRSDKRSKCRINKPSATLDLSSILPVCFADKENSKRLKEYCDIITVKELNKSIKAFFIEHIIESKRKVYGIDEVSLSGEFSDSLDEYGIDAINSILTEIISSSHTNKLILNKETLQPYIRKHTSGIKYGFGEYRE